MSGDETMLNWVDLRGNTNLLPKFEDKVLGLHYSENHFAGSEKQKHFGFYRRVPPLEGVMSNWVWEDCSEGTFRHQNMLEYYILLDDIVGPKDD